MKNNLKKIIGVYGSWHLATIIISSFLKKGFKVFVFDDVQSNIKILKKGKLPIFEPGLIKIIKQGIKNKKLIFSSDFKKDINIVDTLFFAKDTIKTKKGVNILNIINSIERISKFREEEFLLIISSQLPVGSSKKIANKINLKRKNKIDFVYYPEFLRLGESLDLFLNQDYIIIGCDNFNVFNRCKVLLSLFSSNFYQMNLSEAEFAKHIANIYIASSVSLISELSNLSDIMGLDLSKIAPALRNDKRIGPKSYIFPGLGFTGGNLERDIKVVKKLLKIHNKKFQMLDTIVKVNNSHNNLPMILINKYFKNLDNVNISFLGITYKSFTNSLEGSLTLKFCKKLLKKGANIKVYDHMIKSLNKDYRKVLVSNSLQSCILNADILVIMIGKKEYKNIEPQLLTKLMRSKYIIDAANCLDPNKFIKANFKYSGIGVGIKN